jgi:hypothetical protein
MTLSAAAAAQVRLIVWCKACQHLVEPDPAERAAGYGADTSVLDWREQLVCSSPSRAAEPDYRGEKAAPPAANRSRAAAESPNMRQKP